MMNIKHYVNSLATRLNHVALEIERLENAQEELTKLHAEHACLTASLLL